MKFKFLFALLMLFNLTALAQMPVHFSVKQNQVSPTEVDVIFTAKIDAGWHVYSPNLGADGPTEAKVFTEKSEGAQAVGKLIAKGSEKNVFDNAFQMKLRYYENNVTFVQKYKITGKTYNISGYLEYGACNDEMCMPPGSVEFNYKGNGPADAPQPVADAEKKVKKLKPTV